MIMKKIKICLSRGWFHVVSGVSFLLLSVMCSSCKSSSAVNRSQNENSETVSTENDSIPLSQLSADMIDKVKAYEKNSDLLRMTAYGPPYDDGEEEIVIDLGPSSKRDIRKARRAKK